MEVQIPQSLHKTSPTVNLLISSKFIVLKLFAYHMKSKYLYDSITQYK